MPDFILNGQGHGSVASTLIANDFNEHALKPWIGDDGRTYIAKPAGVLDADGKMTYNAVPTANATATLRKDEWKHLDEAVIRVGKERLKVFGDLRAAGLSYTIPNGMGKTVLEYEDQSDISPATVSMDGLREGEADRPLYDLKSMPLPIIHKDFRYSARQIAASRAGNTPLDTTSAELAARRVAEEVEKLTLGTATGITYGGGTIYGMTNFPNRLTKTLSDPAGGGWTPATLVQEVLAMRTQANDVFHYGPWGIYHGTFWDEYMDDDYSAAKGDNTLRQRIAMVDGINFVRTADYLTGNALLLVQQTQDVVRAVVAMDMTTLQWESQGGMMVNYKVMAILLPQVRADQNDNTGIVHGSF